MVNIQIEMLRPADGRHRRWPGRPAKTLLHAAVMQKGFRFALALAGLKSPFFLQSNTSTPSEQKTARLHFRSMDEQTITLSLNNIRRIAA